MESDIVKIKKKPRKGKIIIRNTNAVVKPSDVINKQNMPTTTLNVPLSVVTAEELHENVNFCNIVNQQIIDTSQKLEAINNTNELGSITVEFKELLSRIQSKMHINKNNLKKPRGDIINNELLPQHIEYNKTENKNNSGKITVAKETQQGEQNLNSNVPITTKFKNRKMCHINNNNFPEQPPELKTITPDSNFTEHEI